MDNDETLPLSRMATINKPSFWLFILACIVLYIINKIIVPDRLDSDITNPHDLQIMWIAFAGLLLNVISVSITNKAITRVFTIICYVFEAAGIITLLFLIFSKS